MQENYCSAIDVGLFVYPTGHVKTCCSGAEWLGDLNKEPVQDIFKKERYIQIQKNLNNNIPDTYCNGCNNLYKITPSASQKFAFERLFPSKQDNNLRLIDIRWSDVCNLTCRYCNVQDSSSWKQLLQVPLINVNKQYAESLLKLVDENKQTISNVYLLGGEPLLQKNNEKLLDLIRPEAQIDVLTNLSIKLENNTVYNKLKKFKRVLWNLSFDNVGKRFEYVRAGASWDIFQHNLDLLRRDFGDNISFHPVYTIWNAINLREYYEFAQAHKLNVNWQLALPRGDFLRTDSFLVFGHKKQIIDKAVEEIDSLGDNKILQNIKTNLLLSKEIPGRDQIFLSWTKKLESIIPSVNTFKDLWPDLYQLLLSN